MFGVVVCSVFLDYCWLLCVSCGLLLFVVVIVVVVCCVLVCVACFA